MAGPPDTSAWRQPALLRLILHPARLPRGSRAPQCYALQELSRASVAAVRCAARGPSWGTVVVAVAAQVATAVATAEGREGERPGLAERLRMGSLLEDGLSYKESFIVRYYEVGINKTAIVETIANLLQCFPKQFTGHGRRICERQGWILRFFSRSAAARTAAAAPTNTTGHHRPPPLGPGSRTITPGVGDCQPWWYGQNNLI